MGAQRIVNNSGGIGCGVGLDAIGRELYPYQLAIGQLPITSQARDGLLKNILCFAAIETEFKFIQIFLKMLYRNAVIVADDAALVLRFRLPLNYGQLIVPASDTANAVRPAHLFDVFETLFVGLERLGNVYQVHGFPYLEPEYLRDGSVSSA